MVALRGHGKGRVTTLGTIKFTLSIDNITAPKIAYVVPDFAQKTLWWLAEPLLSYLKSLSVKITKIFISWKPWGF